MAGELEGMQYNVEAQATNALIAFYTGYLLDPHGGK